MLRPIAHAGRDGNGNWRPRRPLIFSHGRTRIEALSEVCIQFIVRSVWREWIVLMWRMRRLMRR